eukprot:6199868-Pleurochrysis_carterae.AAC.2
MLLLTAEQPLAPTRLTLGDAFISPKYASLPDAERLPEPSTMLEPESALSLRHPQRPLAIVPQNSRWLDLLQHSSSGSLIRLHASNL